MDSDALLTFLTVHRRGGISSAAKALHRSQPAISRRIALLEQELGVPLFERIAGRTMLSDAGRVMVPYAERAVAAAQDAENAVRALARPNSGPIALAVVGTLAGGRLSAILKRFAAEHPEVELSLRTATSAEVSDLIRRGEATIGLRYDRDRSRDLDCELLFAERLQVVCAPRPSARRPPCRKTRRSAAASAGSHFPWCRDGARSRRHMCLRCFRPTGSAKSTGRRSTA